MDREGGAIDLGADKVVVEFSLTLGGVDGGELGSDGVAPCDLDFAATALPEEELKKTFEVVEVEVLVRGLGGEDLSPENTAGVVRPSERDDDFLRVWALSDLGLVGAVPKSGGNKIRIELGWDFGDNVHNLRKRCWSSKASEIFKVG